MKTIAQNFRLWTVLILCMIAAVHSSAQENPAKDPMQEFLFPPELVMRYQNEIQLKKEQKELIIQAVEDAQKKFNRLQWDLQGEVESLQKLLSTSSVNETKVLEQLDKVLDQERTIKKTQITLMVRIKNTLSGEQQTKLNSFKGK
jgi:Spy/CpxP family protein refolding chaperone